MGVLLACDLPDPTLAGPPVVFLGALGSQRAVWRRQVAALAARGLAALPMDLRGHGHSPAPPGPYSMAELADDVALTLDRLGCEKVHLVGMSLGGAVSQQLAISAPERVATLVLLSTSARFGDRTTWLERAAGVRSSGTGAIAEGLQGRWLTEDFCRARPETFNEARQMILDAHPEGYAACAEALAGWSSWDYLGKIDVPTLVVGGAQDPSTTPSVLGTLAGAIAGARHVSLDPGAHLVCVERADEVSELIMEHVGSGWTNRRHDVT